MADRPDTGILLVNLGTPDAPEVAQVRAYLQEFLTDPFVIDLPAPLRYLLVHGVILRTRPARSAAAYRKIWTERGSPLRIHGEDLAVRVRELTRRPVALGMRYRNPSVAAALDALRAAGCARVDVLLLFPQYSESAWETAARHVTAAAAKRGMTVALCPPFFDHPAFLGAFAAVARPHLAGFAADRVLLSFHGLPERHIRRTDASPTPRCLVDADCCAAIVDAHRLCYRAHCFATARGLASRLGLAADDYEVTFQSRLTRRWIQPFTDVRIRELAAAGCKRLAVVCPAFVADCLETLEEIAMAARDSFREHGGEDLLLVPSLNSEPVWAEAVVTILRRAEPARLP